MSDLQARIGRKVTQLYPNLTWKRPGAVPQSPSKNTLKSSQAQAHQSDEKDDDASREHASSTFSSPRRQLSLLRRMGLSSDDHPASEGKEAAGIQPSLLSRVQDNTPQPSSSSVCLLFPFYCLRLTRFRTLLLLKNTIDQPVDRSPQQQRTISRKASWSSLQVQQ